MTSQGQVITKAAETDLGIGIDGPHFRRSQRYYLGAGERPDGLGSFIGVGSEQGILSAWFVLFVVF